MTNKTNQTQEIKYERAPVGGEKPLQIKGGIKKMTKRILVIEDNQEHTMDAQRFFATQKDVNVTYVPTYNEARERIRRNIDGVISDIYFPLSYDSEIFDKPEPIGVRVAVELSQLGIPFVLNTAGYHHGSKYEWINQLARSQHWRLIDASSDYYNEASSKNWGEAWQTLEGMINSKEVCQITL